MNRMACGGHNRGFTLVELVISLVVISIALGGVLMVMNYTVQHSADPMLQHQAVAIAEAYLEEVLLRSYNDPDGTDAGETRSTFDDVEDYDGLNDAVARDQEGTAIASLASYSVLVTVDDEILNGIAAKRVTVTVNHPSGINLSLSGFKTNY
jgi:MSHA pilin protein MshD